jgi:lipoprotein NlpD
MGKRFFDCSICLLGLGVILFAPGCATTKNLDEESLDETMIHLPEPERQGVYHKVKPSETLWRIAKTYQVSLEDIVKMNNIPDAARVEENQLIFIPGVTALLEIPEIQKEDEKQTEFAWPLQGKIIRYFREPIHGYVNKGIDIEAREGEPVKAARSGRVVLADYLSGQGQTVILDHEDGFFSIYSQNSKLNVKLGDAVKKSEVLAFLGRQNSSAYLHFEIRKNSLEDNPLFYLP